MARRCEHRESRGFFSVQCARTAAENAKLCEEHGGVAVAADSLSVARRQLFAKLDGGTKCPCCDKYAKRYRRKVNTEMAMFLIGLFKVFREEGKSATYREAFEAVGWSGRAGDYAYLAHWGLVEKGDEGDWRPTPRGLAFVQGHKSVARYAWLYNDEPEAFSEEETTIEQALGDGFDYRELMGGWPCPSPSAA